MENRLEEKLPTQPVYKQSTKDYLHYHIDAIRILFWISSNFQDLKFNHLGFLKG